MHGQPSAREMVEVAIFRAISVGATKARPMPPQDSEPIGVCGRIKGDEEALGRG